MWSGSVALAVGLPLPCGVLQAGCRLGGLAGGAWVLLWLWGFVGLGGWSLGGLSKCFVHRFCKTNLIFYQTVRQNNLLYSRGTGPLGVIGVSRPLRDSGSARWAVLDGAWLAVFCGVVVLWLGAVLLCVVFSCTLV